jgi:hypothetical protein
LGRMRPNCALILHPKSKTWLTTRKPFQARRPLQQSV